MQCMFLDLGPVENVISVVRFVLHTSAMLFLRIVFLRVLKFCVIVGSVGLLCQANLVVHSQEPVCNSLYTLASLY
jgi:hypothetical protein